MTVVERALTLAESSLGKEHPETLRTVDNLAALYRAQGRHGEAEALSRQALDASERVLGQDHPETLRRINNLVDGI
jgi:hypothetical protein